MSKKRTIVIIAVIVMVVITIGIFVLQKRSKITVNQNKARQLIKLGDENADWQLFSDDSIGISVKIPMNWERKISSSSDKSIIGGFIADRKGALPISDEYTPHGVAGGDYSFTVMARDNKSDEAKNFENYLNNPDKYLSKVSFGNKVILQDGTVALRNVIEGPGKTFNEQRGNNITYAFEKNNKYYEVYIVYDGNGMSSGMGEEILSTLKFTK